MKMGAIAFFLGAESESEVNMYKLFIENYEKPNYKNTKNSTKLKHKILLCSHRGLFSTHDDANE